MMLEYNEDMLIAKRNIVAIGGVLTKHEESRQQLETKVVNLSKEVADLREQMNAITSQMALVRIKMMGTGSTS